MNLNKLNIIWRCSFYPKQAILSPISIQKCVVLSKSTNRSNNDSSSSSSSSSDSDDDIQTKKPTPVSKNEETISKLNSLLQQLVQNDKVAQPSALKLARPKDKRVPKEQRESRKIESVEKKLVKAVNDVAQDIGGDVKQTESELLSKLLSPVQDTEPLKSLNEIVQGMRIERETKPTERSKAEQIRNMLQNIKSTQKPNQTRVSPQRSRPRQPILRDQASIMKVDLLSSAPLGIFTNKDLKDKRLDTWQKLYQNELKLAVTHPPANYFQEMILWTEQGKLWKFPIDNEQGLEDEKKVDFSKHIFLEEHLEPWCPQRGPIRHYMELVCVGLSKNPYITVDAKIEHIMWYKNYFDEKKKLLKEIGAIPTETNKPEKQPEEH
ncbi:unnamed protein product [Phyllotreta striolata]|uniref:Small ribosomal subunit protein mS31 n=1 Tax=Phyllotreta striolata TaxID=444603 RepID=A0A9N9TXF7_PHYSR|nr:unnamed protein product [Phyllotreta striolata]